MNKPAHKEPSMDEILSSIRQIIADDDAAGAPRRPAIQAAPPPMQAAPVHSLHSAAERDLSDMLDEVEPLALSPEQIVQDDDGDDFSFESLLAETGASSGKEEANAQDEEELSFNPPPQLVEPDDLAFSSAEQEDDLPTFNPPPPPSRPQAATPRLVPDPEPAPPPAAEAPKSAPRPEPQPEPQPQARAPQPEPLPDPTLTSDMADQLLEPATKAAVRSSISRLNNIGLGNGGATIESMMRDMLRPMLKEWLDENLPSVVERMVEKEIARLARGD